MSSLKRAAKCGQRLHRERPQVRMEFFSLIVQYFLFDNSFLKVIRILSVNSVKKNDISSDIQQSKSFKLFKSFFCCFDLYLKVKSLEIETSIFSLNRELTLDIWKGKRIIRSVLMITIERKQYCLSFVREPWIEILMNFIFI